MIMVAVPIMIVGMVVRRVPVAGMVVVRMPAGAIVGGSIWLRDGREHGKDLRQSCAGRAQ